MTKSLQNQDGGSLDALEFKDQDLVGVTIADEDLETEDSNAKEAKKKAKKRAKSQLSESELKKLRLKKWFIGIGVCAVIVIVPLAVPFTRWPVLNAIGVRSSMGFTVIEQKDKIPLSNASIWLDDTYFTTTDVNGVAQFENTRLGPHTVTVQKNGYSREDITVTSQIFRTNTLVSAKAIGIKISLDVRNWLTGEPIEGATVGVGKDTVQSDKTGRASVVIAPDSTTKTKISVSAPGYTATSVSAPVSVGSKEVSLVSSAKNYFISKREGKLDVFSSNLDSSAQQKVIEATGKEDSDLLQFTVHRGNRYAILVANRDGKVLNNRVVAGIYVIDFSNASLRKIDEGSDVQLLEWGDDSIVFQKTDPSLQYNDTNFTQLITYNPISGKLRQLASANYFPVALVAQNKLFYAAVSGDQENASAPLSSINLTSSATKTYVADHSASYATRSSYDSLTLLTDNSSYYNVAISNGSVKQIDRRVDSMTYYSLSPNGGSVVWADKRDGQGSLQLRSTTKDDTRTVAKLSGLTNPTRWITDRLVVVRVVTTTETADYLVDVPTAKTVKIVDVSDVRQFGLML